MAPGDGPPLSLRPFPVADRKPKNLAEFVARVNAQPGGFRAVTEEQLRGDVDALDQGGDGDADEQDVDMSDGAGDEQEDDEDAATKDPSAVRMEVLKNVEIAGNTAMLMLDSLSLLLSKQNPTQASLTLSQRLRDAVGIGTLGADKLDDSNVTAEKVKDQEDVAIGWTLLEINKARDAAEEASSFLQREMEAESRYWEDVMAVQRAGWSVCKMPQEKHTLGVRFGFSEATQEFKSHSLAAMRRGDNGSVQLDCGRLGGLSERLAVTYERDGQVVGRSALPARTPDNAPLEVRVLEARNTVFAQELWHELAKEARTLIAHDVRPVGARLTYAVEPAASIALELVPLGDESSADGDRADNTVAEGISLALHILLSYAHRYNELMRTRPLPPHIPRSRAQQATYALLRPIIARFMSFRTIKACTAYVGALVRSLKRAGLPASFVLHTAQGSLSGSTSAGPNQPSGPQVLVRAMLQPLEFTVKLAILPDVALTIRGRTYLHPFTATYYHVILPPSSPLHRLCAPYKDGYPDTNALAGYLRTATARLLMSSFLVRLRATPSKADWVQGMKGASIRDSDKEDLEVRFALEESEPSKPSLVVAGVTRIDGKPKSGRWVWRPDDDAEDNEPRTLDEIVEEAVGQPLK